MGCNIVSVQTETRSTLQEVLSQERTMMEWKLKCVIGLLSATLSFSCVTIREEAIAIQCCSSQTLEQVAS